MPKMTIKIVVVGVAWLFSSAAVAQTCRESLLQLVGNWEDDRQDTIFIEQWSVSDDEKLRGQAESRSKTGDKVYMSEKMVLEQRGNELIYVVDVADSEGPVEFRLVNCQPDSVVFENPENEFPKRIEYHFPEPGVLHAHVTDMEDKGFDLHFSRVD